MVARLHEQTEAPTYRTTNWHDDNLALAKRGSLSIWFDPETQWLSAPTGRRGRQPVFADAAVQACLTLKALFGLPLRQIEPWSRHWFKAHGEGEWLPARLSLPGWIGRPGKGKFRTSRDLRNTARDQALSVRSRCPKHRHGPHPPRRNPRPDPQDAGTEHLPYPSPSRGGSGVGWGGIRGSSNHRGPEPARQACLQQFQIG